MVLLKLDEGKFEAMTSIDRLNFILKVVEKITENTAVEIIRDSQK